MLPMQNATQSCNLPVAAQSSTSALQALAEALQNG
jgi:hypothetical protein